EDLVATTTHGLKIGNEPDGDVLGRCGLQTLKRQGSFLLRFSLAHSPSILPRSGVGIRKSSSTSPGSPNHRNRKRAVVGLLRRATASAAQGFSRRSSVRGIAFG